VVGGGVGIALPNLPVLENQGGACGAAGPASAPGSALARPARRTPGHTRQGARINWLTCHADRNSAQRLLAPDCPARSHRVKGGHGGRRFAQTLDSAVRSQGFWRLRQGRSGLELPGACRTTGVVSPLEQF